MHVAGSVKQNQLTNKESLSNWHYYYVMLYAIWYHLKNFKNVKNTHGRVLLVVKLQASACNFTKSNTSSWVILYIFLKLYKWYKIAQSVYYILPNVLIQIPRTWIRIQELELYKLPYLFVFSSRVYCNRLILVYPFFLIHRKALYISFYISYEQAAKLTMIQ